MGPPGSPASCTRFPLFGGWKTHYDIGYNVPSYEYLYEYNHVLNMRLIDHIADLIGEENELDNVGPVLVSSV